jgi:hypothetical protein
VGVDLKVSECELMPTNHKKKPNWHELLSRNTKDELSKKISKKLNE